MKNTAMVAAFLAAGLAACSTNPTPDSKLNCGLLDDAPAPTQEAIDASNCPASTDVYLSAVFDDGKPVGVGGGTDAGTGNKNDKEVSGGQNVCWLATDTSGNSATNHFDILFSPSQKPVANQPHESVEIHPQAPKGAEYKYTIWTSSGTCGFLDPRFVIN
jgi:hypothetical protein